MTNETSPNISNRRLLFFTIQFPFVYLIIFDNLKTCNKFEYTSLEDKFETDGRAITRKSMDGSMLSFIS
ncbi:hypothetical protein GCM10025854_24400 [Tetragenococcus muriaticus]|nr:hypothetical protein GCM10025854_24400 [Tetragenococcus muriaticus]